MAESKAPVKVVLVGDTGVGKTSLQITLGSGNFPDPDRLPGGFDVFNINVPIDGGLAEMTLIDTPGNDDLSRLRRLSYLGTDVFAVCFAVDNPASFERVTKAWIPELSYEQPGVPVVLLGLRADLRDDQATVERLASDGKQPLTVEDGKGLCAKLKAKGYLDISAKTGTGTKEALSYLAGVGLKLTTHQHDDSSSTENCCMLM